MHTLSLILPVHNESKGIAATLKNIIEVLEQAAIRYEMICVENGSTDNSFQILKNLAEKNKHVRVIQSEKGWGNAVKAGITEAKGTYLCYMVSDGQVSPSHIVTLYNYITVHNIALVKVKRVTRENSKRLLNSKAYNLIAKLILGITADDINGTPKMIKTNLIKKIPFHAKNIGFDIELLYTLKKMKLSWKEFPVNSTKRDKGKSTTDIKSVIEMMHEILKLRS
jgi:glycosyltransferase involved in cell wall biosynthesis